jgi:hypothetical protein
MSGLGDDLPATRPWFNTWRVSYWRAGWSEPRRAEFGLLADATRFANHAASHSPSKADGPVVRVQIEERLTSAWKVIHQFDPSGGHGARARRER